VCRELFFREAGHGADPAWQGPGWFEVIK
jgi:hypothetical protein